MPVESLKSAPFFAQKNVCIKPPVSLADTDSVHAEALRIVREPPEMAILGLLECTESFMLSASLVLPS